MMTLIATFSFLASMAAWSCDDTGLGSLEEVTSRYRAAAMVEMAVDKKVHQEALGSDKTYKGTIYYSSGRIRWEITEPDKNWLVFDGKTLWSVQFPSPDFPGNNQVVKSRLSKKNRQQVLLINLIGLQKLGSQFKLKSESKLEAERKLFLEPIAKDSGITKLVATIDPEKNEIRQLEYTDDVGNVVNLIFRNIKFYQQSKPDLFHYKPGPKDQVTDA